ncbi:MAG: quinolinate synthase NadA [Myxococcales bacterium]|nr:quinolinate synthase NadA [Myxococcales bacterium]
MSSIAEPEVLARLRRVLGRLGPDVLLLTHHYQRAGVVALGHRVGDSYELARAAAENRQARTVVFCGVRFMAEAAEVLRREEQRVVHPEPLAGCPMADMADASLAETAWRALEAAGAHGTIPVVYMNSSAQLKAWVGERGGCVCTSSNSERAFVWALARARRLLFLPDEHLGRNTARRMGIAEAEMALWDPKTPAGGVTPEALARARVVLWKGFCHVHTAFTVEQVRAARERFPGARVLVHPECTSDVVLAADGSGSTSYLVRAAAEAAPGSTLVIGTEINLVSRLAAEYPDRTIVPLARSLCPNMYRLSPERLLTVLEDLDAQPSVEVPAKEKASARLALHRMLEL